MHPVTQNSKLSHSAVAFRVLAPICVLLLPFSIFFTAMACALIGLIMPLTSNSSEINEFGRPYRQWVARSLAFGGAGFGLVFAGLFLGRPDGVLAFLLMYVYILAVTSCFGQAIRNAMTASRLKSRYR